jgi:hypothetical protein
VAHLPLGDQLLDCARDLLDRHFRIDAVLIEEVDAIRPQALKRPLEALLDRLGAAVETSRAARRALEVEAELGGDHDFVAHRLERLAHKLFVRVRTVDLGRVEEGDPELHCTPDHLDRRRPVGVSSSL